MHESTASRNIRDIDEGEEAEPVAGSPVAPSKAKSKVGRREKTVPSCCTVGPQAVREIVPVLRLVS